MNHNIKSKRIAALLLCIIMALTLTMPAAAAEIKYMPDVTAEMSDASYWAKRYPNADEIILNSDEIKAFNEDTYLASGTMVMDLRTIAPSFDGKARNEAVKKSAKADAEYYFGWTYGSNGKKAPWSYYQKMIDNCVDPTARSSMTTRYAIAVERTTLHTFPTDEPIWDDPADRDFNYQHLSAVQVNDPLVLYTTSRDGKFYLARSKDCSGWISAEDVAICKDKEEWESAWVIPETQLLVVYGNKVYTDASNTAPETARRMLGQGTRLELVTDLKPDQLVNNRSPYHNYVIYLPVRRDNGSYAKKMALLPETAKVSVGYLPLTMENIAMVALQNLGDAYGWGGMMDVEDCSGLIRTIYACFGLEIGRNGNWQWNMNMEKIDMANMSMEEKLLILDKLPLGAALSFPGHEMMYLGKVDGKYYVISTVSSIMSPDTGKRLRTRNVMINTLDVKRANGQSWLQALNMAFMPCYAKLEGKTYDFPEVQWYRDGVGYVLKNSFIANYGNGYFGPDDMASREVAVNALWRMAGRPAAETTEKYTDISASAYTSGIFWADEIGIACGRGNGIFGPKESLTREQLATMLWRYAKYKGYDVSVGEDTNLLSYNDAFKISEYAIPAMQWVCGAGILTGVSSGGSMALKAQEETTRAQLSVALMRFNEWMKQAKYAPHIFDLSQGDLIFSAGAEEYNAYLTADPIPEKVPAPAYASQDGGETWTKLKGEIIVVSSQTTENIITLDFNAPYGEITLTLDGVNTSGDMMFSAMGNSTIIVKGDVTIGTIVSGIHYGVGIRGAEGGQSNTLTVNSPNGYGVVASADIFVENLDALHVNAGRHGIYSEAGCITFKNVSGVITAGKGFAAIRSDNPDAIIAVNGNELTEEIGCRFELTDQAV